MKKLIKLLPVFCLLLQTNISWAEELSSQKIIQYQNQREEVFDLENFLKQTEYKDEEVKDTCTKQVPYEEKVCKDVTKYKKECKTIPAHEECQDVNHPICHDETHMENVCTDRTRRECHSESVPDCHMETKYETVCSQGRPEQQCRTVTEPVCHYETRNHQECRTVPGEQQCRVVIRYHEECNTVPGGRQCRQIPPDIRCRIINGENKCEKIPGREECTDAPSRRVCSQKPYEERECSTGPSRQECRNVPTQEQVCENRSRQECTTIPGRQECRQEPRQEQVCTYRTEQRCEDVPTGQQDCVQVPRTEEVCKDNYEKECRNVPAKKECKNVPYKENVCKMETKYKDEQYECTKTIQVPHEVVVAHYKAHVQMNFDAKASDAASKLWVTLTEKGQMELNARDMGESNLLIFAKKAVTEEQVKEETNFDVKYNVVMLDKEENFKFLKYGIEDLQLHSRKVNFSVAGKLDLSRATLVLQISKKDKEKVNKTIRGSELNADFDGERTNIEIDLKKLGAPLLGGIIHREHNVYISLKLDYSQLGENVLNPSQVFEVKTNTVLKVQ